MVSLSLRPHRHSETLTSVVVKFMVLFTVTSNKGTNIGVVLQELMAVRDETKALCDTSL